MDKGGSVKETVQEPFLGCHVGLFLLKIFKKLARMSVASTVSPPRTLFVWILPAVSKMTIFICFFLEACTLAVIGPGCHFYPILGLGLFQRYYGH